MGRKLAVILIAVAGCAATPKPAPEPKPEAAPNPLEYALFDGKTGKPIDLAALVARADGCDFFAFGELHGHPAGSLVQKEVLGAMLEQERPVALAMEFFERDTQGVVDRYLTWDIEEGDFKKWARQGKAYATSHRALIELCKENESAVIAANAPRRLAKEFRKSGLDYAEFLEAVTEAERSYLPRAWSDLSEAESEPFFAAMGGLKPGQNDTFGIAMALWDDAMAEACADAREQDPQLRVILMVGAFHAKGGAHTVRKYRERRSEDRILTLIMRIGELAYSAKDEGLGDFVMKVHAPPRPKRRAPAAAPAKHP